MPVTNKRCETGSMLSPVGWTTFALYEMGAEVQSATPVPITVYTIIVARSRRRTTLLLKSAMYSDCSNLSRTIPKGFLNAAVAAGPSSYPGLSEPAIVRHVPLLNTRRMALESVTKRSNALCAVVMPAGPWYLAVALSPSAKPPDASPLRTLVSPARETCRIRGNSPTNSVVVAWKMVMQFGKKKRAAVPLPSAVPKTEFTPTKADFRDAATSICEIAWPSTTKAKVLFAITTMSSGCV
jgi:hypothetical protein